MIAADILQRARAWVQSAQTPTQAEIARPQDDEALAVQIAAQIARPCEGLYLHPYLCPAGVPSIGYGATYYQDGRRVTLKDDPITPQEAEQLLIWMLRTVYLPGVRRLCPHVTDPGQLGALIDFAYNLGVGRLQTSTLRKRVNANAWHQVPTELRKWVMAAGKKLRGLVSRREAEIAFLPPVKTA